MRLRTVSALILAASLCVSARGAEEVLFPAPLHITREVTGPVSQTRTVIDEYCQGNRVVAISGQRTSIVDYAKGTVTTIDFAAGEYSVTPFEAIARVGRVAPPAKSGWKVTRDGAVVEVRGARESIRVTPRADVRLSRAALEAISGTAYPNQGGEDAQALAGALRIDRPRVSTTAAAAAPDQDYALPGETIIRHEEGGEVLESRNVVTRVGDELPPPQLLAIPPGARLVESRAMATGRMLDELDGRRQ